MCFVLLRAEIWGQANGVCMSFEINMMTITSTWNMKFLMYRYLLNIIGKD